MHFCVQGVRFDGPDGFTLRWWGERNVWLLSLHAGMGVFSSFNSFADARVAQIDARRPRNNASCTLQKLLEAVALNRLRVCTNGQL